MKSRCFKCFNIHVNCTLNSRAESNSISLLPQMTLCDCIYFFVESPDLNPIEMVWAHMKREVAKAEPRTKEALIGAIVLFLERYFNNKTV